MKQSYRIYLASKSPRRQELMKEMGLDFEVLSIDVAEEYNPSMEVSKVPLYLAELKAAGCSLVLEENEVLITSDTVVILNGVIYGKPMSKENATEMLKSLSGNTHEVHTGVVLKTKTTQKTFGAITKVSFDEISNQEIAYYLEQFNPLDKAGSYGIQDWLGYVKINKIEGCYYNVMGLPLRDLYRELIKLGAVS